jgi:predicted DNA-binding transcriptional regulator AlpA
MTRPHRPEAAVEPEAANGKPPVDRMTLRLDEVARALGVSRRLIERERSAGRLPKPDLTIGRVPLWRVQTITSWLERGGHP